MIHVSIYDQLMTINLFLLIQFYFSPRGKSHAVFRFHAFCLVKEYSIETESTARPILYSSRPFRPYFVCY